MPAFYVYAPDDVSEMLDQFNHMLGKILDHHAPIKELMGRRDRLLDALVVPGWSLYCDSQKVVKTKLRQAERECTFRRS